MRKTVPFRPRVAPLLRTADPPEPASAEDWVASLKAMPATPVEALGGLMQAWQRLGSSVADQTRENLARLMACRSPDETATELLRQSRQGAELWFAAAKALATTPTLRR